MSGQRLSCYGRQTCHIDKVPAHQVASRCCCVCTIYIRPRTQEPEAKLAPDDEQKADL